MAIIKYDTLPVGSVLTVAYDQDIPSGWTYIKELSRYNWKLDISREYMVIRKVKP